MRRILHLMLAVSATMVCALSSAAAAGPSILFDSRTGQVIESDRPFDRWYPASLTKLMTTYVAFRMVETGEVTFLSPVRMTRAAANQPPSKMGYKPGTVMTLDTALKIIMVKSANDVSAAIADSLSGSAEAFAARMNAESRRLGMTDSNWVNAHGLHDDNQYTTARDLAILSAALRNEFPQYADYFAIEGLRFGDQVIPSHNRIVGTYDGADGMKTGYTCPSGYNLVASATREGRTLMAIVLGATSVKSRTQDAARMLETGFASPNAGAMTLAALKPGSAQSAEPVNMRADLCTKAGSEKLRKRERELLAKKKKDGTLEQPVQLAKRTSRELVDIKLGGATGPATPAVAAALAEEAAIAAAEAAKLVREELLLYRQDMMIARGRASLPADEAELARANGGIPLPTWRPDQPPPAGTEPVAMEGNSADAG